MSFIELKIPLLPQVLIALTLGLFAGASAPVMAESADEPVLELYTEDFAPFNYLENGQLMGIGADQVRAVLREAGLGDDQVRISVYPWARSLHLTMASANACIFSMARLPEREDQFLWIGELMTTREVIIGSHARFKSTLTPETARSNIVGVVRQDSGAALVGALGWKFNRIYEVANHEQLLRMLLAGRIQLWSVDELRAWTLFRDSDTSADDYFPVYVHGSVVNYLACNSALPEPMKERLQKSYQKLVNSGELERIRARYLSDFPTHWR